MFFKRLQFLARRGCGRNWYRLSSSLVHSSIPPNRTTIFALSAAAAGLSTLFLLNNRKQVECLVIEDVGDPQQPVPRRLQRFLNFASIEYNGLVYMSPVDFLDSLVLDEPRERVFRNVLNRKQVEHFLRATPLLKNKQDRNFFRRLGHDGLISYSEYLFLLTLLTKSHTSFKIAFTIFDDDANQRIDKQEFMRFERLTTLRPNDVGRTTMEMKKAVTHPKEEEQPETTLLRHLFGPSGRNTLSFEQFQQFYENLQAELVEIEFNEFARGKEEITAIDFTRLVFRYTIIQVEDQAAYIGRVNERLLQDEKGITKEQFEQFSRFLNRLEDFTRAVKLYMNANIPVSKDEFIRAVKCSTGLILDDHLVSVLFKIFDTNDDDQLSYAEFIAVMNDRVNRGFKNKKRGLSGTGWTAFKNCVHRELASH